LNFLDTKAPLVLLYRDIGNLPDASRYDVMLTPQFYVLKRESLPVKYPFQAKKLAPSILDDLTGEGSFTHEVFQEGDQWVFVAYDLEALSRFLESRGSSIDRVHRIYFAEQAKEQFATPVALNDREALTLVNDTVTVVPRQLLGDAAKLTQFDETFRPQKSFDLKRNFSSFLDTRLAIALASVLVLLGLAYFADGYRYHKAVLDAENQLDSLLAANPSLRGAYARKAIHTKYMTIDKAQRQIRDRIKDVSRLVGKDAKIKALSLDTKGYRATLEIAPKSQTAASLKTLAESSGLKHVKAGSGTLETWGTFQ